MLKQSFPCKVWNDIRHTQQIKEIFSWQSLIPVFFFEQYCRETSEEGELVFCRDFFFKFVTVHVCVFLYYFGYSNISKNYMNNPVAIQTVSETEIIIYTCISWLCLFPDTYLTHIHRNKNQVLCNVVNNRSIHVYSQNTIKQW